MLSILLLGAVVGGAMGLSGAPVTYVAFGMYEIGPAVTSPGWADDAVMEEGQASAIDITTLQSPEMLEAVAGKLAARGYRVPSAKQTNWLKEGLRIQYYPQNTSVVVSFRSSNARLVDGVVDAILAVVETDHVHGLRSIRTGRPGGPPLRTRNVTYLATGAVVGAGLGLFALWFARRQFRAPGPTR